MSLFGSTGPVAVVAAQDLALGYGRRTILEVVNLEIMPGAWWFLLGPNGAGKSTLVKALLGLLLPLKGGIALARALEDRQRLGYVPQGLDLARAVPTTVREFVACGLTGLAITAQVGQERVAAAIARVGLDARADVAALSGGQRQRAAIARALVRDPLLLVVDEPATGLDVVAQQDLMDLLATLNREQAITIIAVGHDLAQARRHASHIALVSGGHVISGPTETLFTADRLKTAFGREVWP